MVVILYYYTELHGKKANLELKYYLILSDEIWFTLSTAVLKFIAKFMGYNSDCQICEKLLKNLPEFVWLLH